MSEKPTFRSVLLGLAVAAFVLAAPAVHAMKLQRQNLTQLIADQFAGKPKLIEPNVKALDLGHDWAETYLSDRPKVRVRMSDKNVGKIMMQGNEAAGILSAPFPIRTEGIVPFLRSSYILLRPTEHSSAASGTLNSNFVVSAMDSLGPYRCVVD